MIADMPSGQFIPHSETQSILAQAAYRTAHERIDLSRSESLLKDIRDKGGIERIGKIKYVTRKGFKGAYATRV